MGSWGGSGPPRMAVGGGPPKVSEKAPIKPGVVGGAPRLLPARGSLAAAGVARPPRPSAAAGVAGSSNVRRPPMPPSSAAATADSESPDAPVPWRETAASRAPTPPSHAPPVVGQPLRRAPVPPSHAPARPVKRFLEEAPGDSSASAPPVKRPALGGTTATRPAGGTGIIRPRTSVLETSRSSGAGSAPVQRPAAPAAATTPTAPAETKTSSENTNNNKQSVKLRKIDVMTKQLIDEWISLDADKKEEGFKAITTQLASRVPPAYLAMMAEQFAAATDAALANFEDPSGNGSTLEATATAEEEFRKAESVEPKAEAVAAKPETVVAKPATIGAKAETKPATPANAGLRPASAALRPAKQANAGASTASTSTDAQRPPEDLKPQATKMVSAFEKKPAAEWETAWSSFMLGFDEKDAISKVFEVSLHGGKADHCISGTVELVRIKVLKKPFLEEALIELTKRHEEFADSKDNCWKLNSLFLLETFPKSASTPWGWDHIPSWGWNQWWSMCERVVKSTDKFRAFDIMLEMLKMMQDKGGCAINQMQVWKDQGRSAKVRKAIGGLGEMSDTDCVETLKAYGVKL